MHRRTPHSDAATLRRAVLGALDSLHRALLLVGVFLFALALTTIAIGGSANRTVNLEFTHNGEPLPPAVSVPGP